MGQHQIQLNEVERFSPTMPLVNEKRYGDIAKQSRKGIALQWKRNFRLFSEKPTAELRFLENNFKIKA